MAATSAPVGPGAQTGSATGGASKVTWESFEHALSAFPVGFMLAIACFCFLRWYFELKQKRYGLKPLEHIEFPILLASFFVGLAAVVLGLAWHALNPPNSSTELDLVFKLGGSVVALGYFVYRAMGGALFATTSVVLTALRDPLLSGRVLVTVSIERGTQWTSNIASVAMVLHESAKMWPEPPLPLVWEPVLFPTRQDGSLRLAPGEKTATSFYLEPMTFGAFYLTVRVVSFAQLWPVPSESFARVCVGPYVPITTSP